MKKPRIPVSSAPPDIVAAVPTAIAPPAPAPAAAAALPAAQLGDAEGLDGLDACVSAACASSAHLSANERIGAMHRAALAHAAASVRGKFAASADVLDRLAEQSPAAIRTVMAGKGGPASKADKSKLQAGLAAFKAAEAASLQVRCSAPRTAYRQAWRLPAVLCAAGNWPVPCNEGI